MAEHPPMEVIKVNKMNATKNWQSKLFIFEFLDILMPPS